MKKHFWVTTLVLWYVAYAVVMAAMVYEHESIGLTDELACAVVMITAILVPPVGYGFAWLFYTAMSKLMSRYAVPEKAWHGVVTGIIAFGAANLVALPFEASPEIYVAIGICLTATSAIYHVWKKHRRRHAASVA